MGLYGCLFLAVRPKRATPVTDIGTALALALAVTVAGADEIMYVDKHEQTATNLC